MAIKNRRALGSWAPMWHIKLPLAKSGSLLRSEVGWVRTGLGGVWRLEVLAQS